MLTARLDTDVPGDSPFYLARMTPNAAADMLLVQAVTHEQAKQADHDEFTVVDFRYQTTVAPDRVLFVETGLGRPYPDYSICDSIDSDDSDDIEDHRTDISCDNCGRYNDNGEGYDGLWGDCADRAESEGRWE